MRGSDSPARRARRCRPEQFQQSRTLAGAQAFEPFQQQLLLRGDVTVFGLRLGDERDRRAEHRFASTGCQVLEGHAGAARDRDEVVDGRRGSVDHFPLRYGASTDAEVEGELLLRQADEPACFAYALMKLLQGTASGRRPLYSRVRKRRLFVSLAMKILIVILSVRRGTVPHGGGIRRADHAASDGGYPSRSLERPRARSMNAQASSGAYSNDPMVCASDSSTRGTD